MAALRIQAVTTDELKQWRASAGLSQTGLARLLGVDKMTISRWERGVRDIPPFLHLALEAISLYADIPEVTPAASPAGRRRRTPSA